MSERCPHCEALRALKEASEFLLKQKLNEQEIALARIFSDAGRLTEDRDKLFQDLLAAHPFYYREWEKAKAENAKLRAALEHYASDAAWVQGVTPKIAREALK